MAIPIPNRFTARIEGDFVVYQIGTPTNKPWKPSAWWPVFIGMPQMQKELKAAGPTSGFLGHSPVRPGLIVQYWRSFEQLEAYAKSKSNLHQPAWAAFNRRMRNSPWRRWDMA
jgi:hypothetical protein